MSLFQESTLISQANPISCIRRLWVNQEMQIEHHKSEKVQKKREESAFVGLPLVSPRTPSFPFQGAKQLQRNYPGRCGPPENEPRRACLARAPTPRTTFQTRQYLDTKARYWIPGLDILQVWGHFEPPCC